MFKASINIVTDINAVQQCAYMGNKIVAITESKEQFPFDVVYGTILLPPYEALVAEMDGNLYMFEEIYKYHLASKEADMFLCVIMKALLSGINITIYVPRQEAELAFLSTLVRYLSGIYGVQIFEDGSCNYNITALPLILCNMYMYDICSSVEMFLTYPPNVSLNEVVINKLILEYSPYMPVKNLESYMNYFNAMKDRVKMAGIPLRQVIM